MNSNYGNNKQIYDCLFSVRFFLFVIFVLWYIDIDVW